MAASSSAMRSRAPRAGSDAQLILMETVFFGGDMIPPRARRPAAARARTLKFELSRGFALGRQSRRKGRASGWRGEGEKTDVGQRLSHRFFNHPTGIVR